MLSSTAKKSRRRGAELNVTRDQRRILLLMGFVGSGGSCIRAVMLNQGVEALGESI
jgi:ABC-type uncharacterized transport system YnjBCD ATPase subunit